MSRRGRSHHVDGATELEEAQAELRRLAAQMRRLGTDKPMCAICGEVNPERHTTASRGLLEDHHHAGRHEGPTVVLCLNHHATLTAHQLAGPTRALAMDRTDLERIAALLIYRCGLKLEEAEIDRRLGAWLLLLSKRIAPAEYADLESPFPTRRRRRL